MAKEPTIAMDFLGGGITREKETIYHGDEKTKTVRYVLDGKRYKTLEAANAAAKKNRQEERIAEQAFAAQEAAKQAAGGSPIIVPSEGSE